MRFHRGRLFDHVHLNCRDLEASRRFYRAVLEVVGVPVLQESERHLAADELWLEPAGDRPPSHVHLAFQASDRSVVDRFHAAALAAGGRDHGAPGERPYHPGYYAAYVLDPDGNNIEVVHHGPFERSADAVVITPKLPG
jgi:catechol 2,3-dioxygenase-like lactoylglutathione lyase family enzyme